MKQTAAEWLWRWFNDNQEATIEEGNNAFQQAKEMFQQQIVEGITFFKDRPYEEITAEQYYNETYGGNNAE
jgi:hypothetical protein